MIAVKKMKTLSILVFVFSLSVQGMAQENIFLSRDFWDTKPNKVIVDQKIQEGHDIAELNANNFDGVTYAILQNAPIETIQYIQSKKGNDVNKITHDGRTYIFWAAYKGNAVLMEYFLEKGAKTNLTDDKGYSILNFAASAGQKNTAVYDLCLAHGIAIKTDFTPNGANALLLAAPFDTDFSLINYFVAEGLALQSKDTNGNDAFNYVAKTGNIALLKEWYNKGIKGNNNAVVFASQGTRNKANGIEVFQYLESLGLKVNTTNYEEQNPLHAIAYRGKDIKLMQYFFEKGVDVNHADFESNTPFLNAAKGNDLTVLSFLFPKVNDINFKNKRGETALALALANNAPEIVTFLLENNASITSLDAEGNNLSYYLMKCYSQKNSSDFERKIALLASNKFDITKAQKNGNTLFHLALAHNDIALLKMMNEYGININAKNNEALTSLHMAAMIATDTQMLNYLISIGAKKEIVTDFEETAYDLALENELLKKNNISLDFLR